MASTANIFVEGQFDISFMERIVKPMCLAESVRPKIIQYSQERNSNITSLIKGCVESRTPFIFTADLDSSPCCGERKTKLKNEYGHLIDCQIIIITPEIEAWYAAGISETLKRRLRIVNVIPSDTAAITKGQFLQMKPQSICTDRDFYLAVLKGFDLALARKRNNSFDYFCTKLCDLVQQR